MASPRDPRGRRDHGKPELLLGKNIAPIYRAQTARPTSSRFTKYNADLPDRYLSQMTPFSTPLCDARVHVARSSSSHAPYDAAAAPSASKRPVPAQAPGQRQARASSPRAARSHSGGRGTRRWP